MRPQPYQVIEYEDIANKIWLPQDPEMTLWTKYYTRELRRKNKQKLTIWPAHCLIGSPGHAVVQTVNDAMQAWATRRQRQVQYLCKGENMRTEMYSVIKAEVVDDRDASTGIDWNLLSELMIADKVFIGGQALRYVVAIYYYCHLLLLLL